MGTNGAVVGGSDAGMRVSVRVTKGKSIFLTHHKFTTFLTVYILRGIVSCAYIINHVNVNLLM